MKYLKAFNLINEGFINPISDYLTDFIDSYDFEIEVIEAGVCDLILKSGCENKIEILGMYQAAIDRMKDDEHIIKDGGTYISFYEGGAVHIRIERQIKDSMAEYKFDNPAQETAYNALLKCLENGEKLKLETISPNGYLTFRKVEGSFAESNFCTIKPDGKVELPILRGRKSQNNTQLPFDDRDIIWFKRILWANKYPNYKTDEFGILHRFSQPQLRKIYNDEKD